MPDVEVVPGEGAAMAGAVAAECAGAAKVAAVPGAASLQRKVPVLPAIFAEAEACSAWRQDRALNRPNESFLTAKRAFDVVSSGLALVALSPVMAGAAVAIKATSKGPVIFKQQRYGKDNVPFTCYKFRSMTVDTPPDIPTAQMQENPAVMTPIGGFLRKTSIDELPQLVNIIKGDMSVVGPRPMIMAEEEQIREREKYGATSVKPGLTGWAQVNGRDELTVEEKAEMDGEYARNMSPLLDAKILLRSVGVVAKHTGYSRGEKRAPRSPSSDCAPMRILVVTQHYWPEPFNFADICEGLAERGFEVTVLTGLPNYPDGDIYPGYAGGHNRIQEHNGVRIVRAPLVPRGHNPVQRVLNYYSFPAAAYRVALGIDPDFDVIVTFQSSPVMQAEPAVRIAEETGIPLLHYVIDIWPECLLAGGVRRDSAVYNHFAKVSAGIYGKADRLAVTSPRFKGYLEELVGRPVSVFDLPQYAEDIFAGADPGLAPAGYGPDRINLTFAGNVGAAQSVDTLVCAAAILANDERFLFHVVGSGSELDRCKRLAAELGAPNVVFHGRHELEEMPSYYAASDAMVATFADDPVLGLTLPRKIQSYMAAGKPIVASVTGEAERVIGEAGCGFCCAAGDAEGLAIACMKLAYVGRAERARMGEAGRLYYQRNFSRESFFETLESELKKMRGTVHGE